MCLLWQVLVNDVNTGSFANKDLDLTDDCDYNVEEILKTAKTSEAIEIEDRTLTYVKY